jgi:hypothetical protein
MVHRRSGFFPVTLISQGPSTREALPGTYLHVSYNVGVKVLISAGEASGEMYGAQLIEVLRRASTRVGTDAFARPADSKSRLEFFGVGGERMRAAGCDTVIDA